MDFNDLREGYQDDLFLTFDCDPKSLHRILAERIPDVEPIRLGRRFLNIKSKYDTKISYTEPVVFSGNEIFNPQNLLVKLKIRRSDLQHI